MFVVIYLDQFLLRMLSCRPCGGTDAIVPSRIFKGVPAARPSPDTSLVMETFSDFLEIFINFHQCK